MAITKIEMLYIEHEVLMAKITDWNKPSCTKEASVMSGEIMGIINFTDTVLSYMDNIEGALEEE